MASQILRSLMVALWLLFLLAGNTSAQIVLPNTIVDTTLTATQIESLINAPNTNVVRGDKSLLKSHVEGRTLVVVDGNAYISGTINGDLIVINGSASLEMEAVVDGTITVVNGQIYASKLANTGERRIRSDLALIVSETVTGYQVRRRLAPAMKLSAGVSGWRFTRVRGHDFGVRLGLVANRSSVFPDVVGKAWIPTVSNDHGFVDFEIGAIIPIASDRSLTAGINFYKKTDTNDSWHIPARAKSFDAFIAGVDFFNYHMKNGVSAAATRKWSDTNLISLIFARDSFRDMGTRNPFSLFGDSPFRANPEIDEGTIVGLTARARFDTRQGGDASGWIGDGVVERAFAGAGGDFEYTRFDVLLRRYDSWRGHSLDFRFKITGSDSPLPLQRTYVVGGYTGLRGFGLFEFAGDRLLVFNTDYSLPLKTFRSEAMIKWELDLITFFDTGTAFFSTGSGRNLPGHTAVTSRVSPLVKAGLPNGYSDLRSDAGIGLTLSSKIFYLSFQIGQNLQDTDKGPRITILGYRDLF